MRQGHLRAGLRQAAPPFSPVLLLGLALKARLRPSLLQPVFDAMLRVVRRRHPDILERMEHYADAVVCIDPTDLPFMLLLEPNPAEPRLTVRRDVDPAEVSATVRGPLETLIALAEGRVDGDALFFSRQLLVDGDTEVVVALRNAIVIINLVFIDAVFHEKKRPGKLGGVIVFINKRKIIVPNDLFIVNLNGFNSSKRSSTLTGGASGLFFPVFAKVA